MAELSPAGGAPAGFVIAGRAGARHAETTGSAPHPRDVPASGATLGLAAGLLVLVTRAPDRAGVLRCDARVLTPQRPPACSSVPAATGSVLPGMRFADPVSGLEVVCTRAGHGVLTFGGRRLHLTPSEPAVSTP